MLRIAVVEDHPRMQRVVCGYIEKAKEEFPEIQTRTYCCGEDFLQVKERYDILILDIDLPGISGIELGHRLRKNGDDTAVEKRSFITEISFIYRKTKKAESTQSM